MKNISRLILLPLLIQTMALCSYSQSSEDADVQYFKSNIALTKFKILGVNTRQYAKCVESENVAEATRKLKAIVIDKVTYVDDGRNYDLLANDGIMTSTTLFDYTRSPTKSGAYQETKENYYVIDEGFRHTENLKADWPPKLKIEATFKWKKCRDMDPIDRYLCEKVGWPWGWFVLENVKVTFEVF